MNKKISELFYMYFKEVILEMTPLPLSGSSRQYFRILTENRSVIGVFNKDLKENAAFIYFSRHFKSKGINVPEVLAEDSSSGIYFLQDLGDETLFSLLEKSNSRVFTDDTVELYRKILKDLIIIQTEASENIDYSYCYPRHTFDRQSMMWDLNYFKYYFLKLAGIAFNEQALEDDFLKFTEYLSGADMSFFMFRDFQSRNIMIHHNDIYYIDYQGGRKGPLQYDLASLLYDAKAAIPQHIRNELLDYYLDCIDKKIITDRDAFKKHYYGFVYIRIMQAMGAYGFRGYYEKKSHFLKSIPYAVENLRWLIENEGLPVKLESLENVFREILRSEKLKHFQSEQNDLLTVKIFSFSYKKGIPYDSSGNGGGFVFDCRAIPNPGREEEFKELTGRDEEVKKYLDNQLTADHFFELTLEMVTLSVSDYLERGFKSLMVAYGCTGGQHRSVYFAEKLFAELSTNDKIKVQLLHNEMNNNERQEKLR